MDSSLSQLSSLSRDFQIALGGVALLAVGALGPWATFLGTSKSGLSGDGVITLILAAVAGGLLLVAHRAGGWTDRRTTIGVAVAGVIALLIAFADIMDVRGVGISVGWGLWLTALGALALCGAVAYKLKASANG